MKGGLECRFFLQTFFFWKSVRAATRFFSEYQDNNLHLLELSLRSSCIYLLFRENKFVLYRNIAIFEFVVVLLPVRKPLLCYCWPSHNNLQSNKLCLITFNRTMLYCSCEKCLQMQISIWRILITPCLVTMSYTIHIWKSIFKVRPWEKDSLKKVWVWSATYLKRPASPVIRALEIRYRKLSLISPATYTHSHTDTSENQRL